MANDIISRSAAKAAGLKWYFTGKPCCHGHVRERRTTTKACAGCQDDYLAEKRRLNAERLSGKPLTARKSAQASGGLTYIPEKPCKRGHSSPRYVLSRNCVECEKSKPPRPKEKSREYAKRWRERNPVRAAEVLRKFHFRHRDRLSEEARERYARNPEPERARTKRWREKNPAGVRAHAMARWALKKGSSGSYTAKDVERILLAQKFCCANCKRDVRKKYHVDHIVALSRGGLNEPYNLQILCPPCNMRKHNKDPIKWAQQNGRLL